MSMCLQAGEHWEKALGLNPLFPQGWFALGYCCLKTNHQDRALQVLIVAKLCTHVASHSMLSSYKQLGLLAAVANIGQSMGNVCLQVTSQTFETVSNHDRQTDNIMYLSLLLKPKLHLLLVPTLHLPLHQALMATCCKLHRNCSSSCGLKQ